MRSPALVVVALYSGSVVGACGGSSSSSDSSATSVAPTVTTMLTPAGEPPGSSVVASTAAAGAPAQSGAVYELDVTVIEDADGGPRLCFWVLDSLPPGCDDPVIRQVVGLDWDRVPAAESSQGTTWADLRLVGTWDGEAKQFVLAETPTAPDRSRDEAIHTFEVPCPEPDGGWAQQPVDPLGRAEAGDWVMQRADLSAAWIASPEGSPEVSVLVVRVADGGAPADAERGVRERYSGPLCIVSGGRPESELMAVLAEVEAAVGDEHVDNLLDSVAGHVVVSVMLATPELQDSLDAQFGDGTVVLESVLQPIE